LRVLLSEANPNPNPNPTPTPIPIPIPNPMRALCVLLSEARIVSMSRGLSERISMRSMSRPSAW